MLCLTQRQARLVPNPQASQWLSREPAPDPAARAGRVDRQPPDLQHMRARHQGV
jgi:hypothetical protein